MRWRRWMRKRKKLVEALDLPALILALVFVVGGVLLVWFTRSVIGSTSGALLVSVLLIPAIVFLVLTGRVEQLTAGGMTAKFRQAGSSPVALEYVSADGTLAPKGSPEDLDKLLSRLSARKPIALTITIGPAASSRQRGRPTRQSYNANALAQYLTILSGFKRFWFVIFVDVSDRLIGFLPADEFRANFEVAFHSRGNRIVRALNNADVDQLRAELPRMGSMPELAPRTTNVDALKKMVDSGFRAMLVVDEDRLVHGIVERERVIAELLASIAESS